MLDSCNIMDCSPAGSSSMDSSGQSTGGGCHFLSPGDIPHPGVEPRFPALQADDLPTELRGKPLFYCLNPPHTAAPGHPNRDITGQQPPSTHAQWPAPAPAPPLRITGRRRVGKGGQEGCPAWLGVGQGGADAAPEQTPPCLTPARTAAARADTHQHPRLILRSHTEHGPVETGGE